MICFSIVLYVTGYAHAIDRMVSMVLSRVVAQGRVSELIVGEDSKALAIDTFMRKQVTNRNSYQNF